MKEQSETATPMGSSSADASKDATSRPKTLAEELIRANHELRASVVSNVLTKGGIGLGIGLASALLIFRRSNHFMAPHFISSL